MAAATMDEVFREFRRVGISEDVAEIMAKVASRRDEFVTKADRQAERETEREAERAVREAERAADRDAFAAKDDVTVLQTKSENTDSAIDRIDKTLVRIDERFVRIDERFERIDERFRQVDERFNGVDTSLARLDEQVKSLQQQNQFIVIPFLFATIAGIVALLTKGSLWGVAP